MLIPKNKIMTKHQKISVKESWYIFSIIMLSIIILLLVYLFLQNPFVTNVSKASFLMPIGTAVNVQITENASQNCVFEMNGAVLPDFSLKQDVNIMLSSTSENAVVRAKVFLIDQFGKIFPLTAKTASNWVFNSDGYYYCQDYLTPSLSLDFLESIATPKTTENIPEQRSYVVVVSFETLPVTSDYQNIWKIN